MKLETGNWNVEMKKNRRGPAVSNTRLLDDLIIILSEAVGELAVQAVDLRKGDVPGAKQRRCNADERITAAMRLVESMSNTGAHGRAVARTVERRGWNSESERR